MEAINSLWEKRSKQYKRALEGVLQKSYPRPLNEFLDFWMYKQVRRAVDKNKNIRLLDLGCGYGRISGKLLNDFRRARTTGIDVAETYVDIYNRDLGPRGRAVVSDIRKLPFRDASFDVVVMVTTLMYLTDNKGQAKALSEMFRVLRPGGKFVIIERNPVGHKIVTLGGLINILRGRKHKEIDSVGFTRDYLIEMVKMSGGLVTRTQGIPLWTLFFPVSFLLSTLSPKFGKFFLSLLMELEEKILLSLTFSLYIAYTGSRKT